MLGEASLRTWKEDLLWLSRYLKPNRTQLSIIQRNIDKGSFKKAIVFIANANGRVVQAVSAVHP